KSRRGRGCRARSPPPWQNIHDVNIGINAMTQDQLAFVFPGQGSQKVGMLAELAAAHPEVETTFAEASAVLEYDLFERARQGPAELINMTECTQPLLLTASVACWR